MKERPKKYFLIPLVAGVCLFVLGIIVLIIALSGNVPSMGESGWFDAESAKASKIFGGAALMIIGLFVSVGVTRVVYSIDTVVKQNRMKKMSEQNEFMTRKLSNDIQKSRTCAYCGSELEENKFECPHCGAKQTKK